MCCGKGRHCRMQICWCAGLQVILSNCLGVGINLMHKFVASGSTLVTNGPLATEGAAIYVVAVHVHNSGSW